MEYYVFASNDCNLKCSYCSVLLNLETEQIPKEPIYSLELLNNFINETQIKYNDTIADIIFFGGEPTLNFDFIEKLMQSQLADKCLPFRYRYMLHTNGLLLANIPDNVLNNLNSIMLSINYERVPHSSLDQGYFKLILDSVHSIKKRRTLPIVARLTITEETSLYTEVALLNPFFDAIYWQIENKYAFKNFNSFYATYVYELSITFNMWLQYLKRGILLRLIPFISSAFFLLHDHDVSNFCCGYNNSMIYVQTNGNCYTCAEDMTTNQNLIGKIDAGFCFDSFGLNNTICKSCDYLPLCMGRCGRMHREFEIQHINEYCKLNRVLFDLIKENISEIKEYCDKYSIIFDLTDPIYHYTEYTP